MLLLFAIIRRPRYVLLVLMENVAVFLYLTPLFIWIVYYHAHRLLLLLIAGLIWRLEHFRVQYSLFMAGGGDGRTADLIGQTEQLTDNILIVFVNWVNCSHPIGRGLQLLPHDFQIIRKSKYARVFFHEVYWELTVNLMIGCAWLAVTHVYTVENLNGWLLRRQLLSSLARYRLDLYICGFSLEAPRGWLVFGARLENGLGTCGSGENLLRALSGLDSYLRQHKVHVRLSWSRYLSSAFLYSQFRGAGNRCLHKLKSWLIYLLKRDQLMLAVIMIESMCLRDGRRFLVNNQIWHIPHVHHIFRRVLLAGVPARL
jgi:hypothetical protein